MKKTLAIFGMVLISSTGFAKTVSCTVKADIADGQGLFPGKRFVVEAIVGGDQNVVEIGNQKVLMMATESVYANSYDIAIVDESANTSEPVIGGTLVPLASKANILGIFDYKRHVFTSVLEKLESAEIDVLAEYNGDSLLLDKSVAAGVAKGVIKTGDPIVLNIESCELK